MDPTLNTLILLAAVSGYGDVDSGGHPSWAERDMHLWTNAVRVQPDAFEEDYAAGGCSYDSFSLDEKTAKPPVYYNQSLNQVARLHSQDMHDNDFFSHSSSDGTPFGARVEAYYSTSFIGENIAYGYSNSEVVVTQGWMCSTEGHRANIMSGDWSELGTGVEASYYTQDFGGAVITPPGPVAMGSHMPQQPASTVTFLSDWQDISPPARYQVVLDGDAHSLSLAYGVASQGVYAVEVQWDGQDCASYYFSWQDEDGFEGTFPEDGSYLVGDACDSALMWEDSQASGSGSLLVGDDDDDDDIKGGCSAAGGPALLGGLAGLLIVAGRRRKSGLGKSAAG